MQIQISQLHLPVGYSEEDLRRKACAAVKLNSADIAEIRVLRRSLDARKKDDIFYVCEVVATLSGGRMPKGKPNDRWKRYEERPYDPMRGRRELASQGGPTSLPVLSDRPVVIGAGPAGLFAALALAEAGYRPILIERGRSIDQRVEDVERFFREGVLDPDSNVQFGVGGAGAFSDGKLNTLIKDREGRGAHVLRTFVKYGASEDILINNKPHVGTDRLRVVVGRMQEAIESLGGTVMTETTVTGFTILDGKLTGVKVKTSEAKPAGVRVKASEGTEFEIPSQTAVLAIGHSARDTFEYLAKEGFVMEPKAFAMGVRVQHKREFINRAQYGCFADKLPAADYKLTHTCNDGRGVYTFCMCPGGYVVNASSEPGRLAINGMSNMDRAADNSNSAVVVTVSPEDCAADYERLITSNEELGTAPDITEIPAALLGMEYQRRLEELAYKAGRGAIPTQRYEDYKAGVASTGCGSIEPVCMGNVTYTELHSVLPPYMADAVEEGMEAFDRKMPGFACDDALLQAIESRTSSPVRIVRDEKLQSESCKGLYPCGEGAGYAGGIMSAAIDGLRVAEAILAAWEPPKES
ncbi:MAG: FAD-dependent oxidoreductase [Lachnospiraceae bacterium]|nr:FAD-dependent oxidoreductase [Lachnospiraceae bacterium]